MKLVDIEIGEIGDGAQARYLYHGLKDIYWADTLEELLAYIKHDLTVHGD